MMEGPTSTNRSADSFVVSRDQRERLKGHRGVTVWFTGLPVAGKTTVATLAEQLLTARGVHCMVLDGDNVRQGLNRDLGFSPSDRAENIRRIGEVAKLFTQAGLVTLVAFISPYRKDRDAARALQRKGDFIEVYLDSPVEVCEARDPRGLYRKARAGEIAEFTGISAPYEAPLKPELVLYTASETPGESARRVVEYLEQRGYLTSG